MPSIIIVADSHFRMCVFNRTDVASLFTSDTIDEYSVGSDL
jgi:hypothetical protein